MQLLVELHDLHFKRILFLLNEVGCSDASPVDFVGAVAIVPLSVLLPEDMMNQKVYEGKKMGWPTPKVRLIYSLTELFKLRQWLHALGVETALSPRGLSPKRGILSRPWHPINPGPLRLIASMRLLPVPLYVPTFPNYLYSPCIATDRWALCPFCLSVQLPNMFPFMIPVTLCSCSIILTNMICLGKSVTYITGLTHRTARLHLPLFVSIPNPPSITPYILL